MFIITIINTINMGGADCNDYICSNDKDEKQL